jgi:hypothetical protein
LFTRTKVCFVSSRCSFEYCASMYSLMSRSKGKCLVINSFYHTNISSSIHFLTTLCTHLRLSHPTIAHFFTVLVWSYHWQFRYPFVSMPLREWTYNSPWHISRFYCSYCFGKWTTYWKGGFPFFPLSPSTTSGYSYH